MSSPQIQPRNVHKVFLRVCKKGQVKKVQTLLSDITDINTRDDDQSTPQLYLCGAPGDHVEMVKQLIENQADVSAFDKSNVNCVMRAVNSSNVQVQEYIQSLPGCLDVNMVSNGGFTALAFCVTNCRDKRLDILRLLLHQGANLDFETGAKDTLWNILVWNSYAMCLEELELLRQYKCNTVCAQNAHGGRTAQISQCCNGSYGESSDTLSVFCGIVDFLIASGCNINDVDDQECTCLAMSTLNGSVACVEYLVNKGASLLQRSFGQNSPLHICVGTSDYKMFSFLLLQLQAQGVIAEVLSMVNNDGYTPFLVYCDGGNENQDSNFLDLFLHVQESVLQDVCEDTCSIVLAIQGDKLAIVEGCFAYLQGLSLVERMKYTTILEETRDYLTLCVNEDSSVTNDPSTRNIMMEEGVQLINNASLLHSKLAYSETPRLSPDVYREQLNTQNLLLP